MGRSFDVLMAGLISGIVAITTTFLGIGGTVLGAVLGSVIYQILSTYVKDPLVEKTNLEIFEKRIVFVIPLLFIIIVEFIYILSIVHDTATFVTLEEITNWSLFRLLGICLAIMGIYPIIQPKEIKRHYGIVIFILGITLLSRGMIDSGFSFTLISKPFFQEFDLLISLCIIIALGYISFKVFSQSLMYYIINEGHKSNENGKKTDFSSFSQKLLRNDNRNSKNNNKFNKYSRKKSNDNIENNGSIMEDDNVNNEHILKNIGEKSTNISTQEELLFKSIGKHNKK